MTKRHTSEESNSFDSVVSVRRVTKVTKGGKRFAFSALVVSGDQNGNIGLALGKSREVSAAIAKATARAKKNRIAIPLRGTTIPYHVEGSHGSSKVIIRSASKGTGVIAGGAMRAIMEAIGIKDVLAKSLGASNQLNVVKATMNALAKLRSVQHIAMLRGKTVQEIIKG
ncbi:30S ribosomal protein S5 [bacterium]|jgi:small subunit ribosomal protein S5|nr:30S ribosomal protein S5 [bacterium]NBX77909.1 30S ribosomal protein S5 [bacterium]